MAEQRFYIQQLYICPECLATLIWQKRRNDKDSLTLVHPVSITCRRSEKKFYPPGVHLDELIPFDLEEAKHG